MWDKPAALNRLADLLMTGAIVLALYGALHYVIRLPLFSLREVRVTSPLVMVSAEQLAALIRSEVRGNFFTLDLAATRRAFTQLPWVRNVSMRRHWPDRLEVHLEEHVPLARWGDGALVNRHGEIFHAAYDGNLPVFLGPPDAAKEMAIQYQFFRRTLGEIGKRLARVQLTPRGAWQLRIEDGPTIELGRDQIEGRLARFVAIYSRTIGELDRRIDVVDLRYANGFAVRMPELRFERKAPARRKATA